MTSPSENLHGVSLSLLRPLHRGSNPTTAVRALAIAFHVVQKLLRNIQAMTWQIIIKQDQNQNINMILKYG